MPNDLDTWRKSSIKERWDMIKEALEETRSNSRGQRFESIEKVFDIIDNMPKKDQPPGMLVNLWLACKEGDGLGIDKNLETLQKLSQVRSQVVDFIPGTQKTSSTQARNPNQRLSTARNTSVRSR